MPVNALVMGNGEVCVCFRAVLEQIPGPGLCTRETRCAAVCNLVLQ